MTCREYKDLMMAYLDGELDDEQKKTFEQHVAACKGCAAELRDFQQLKRITDDVKLIEPEDRIWAQYWGNIYNRVERGTGWIVSSIAAILLIVYALFKAVEELIRDPAVETWLKIAIGALIFGAAILFVSVLRERLYFWRKDRYKDVRR